MILGKTPSACSKNAAEKRAGSWQTTQRSLFKKRTLPKERIDALNNTDGWKSSLSRKSSYFLVFVVTYVCFLQVILVQRQKMVIQLESVTIHCEIFNMVFFTTCDFLEFANDRFYFILFEHIARHPRHVLVVKSVQHRVDKFCPRRLVREDRWEIERADDVAFDSQTTVRPVM